MNRVFRHRGYFTVPDGTNVSPFLNATDVTQQDVPWGVLGDMSLAAGRIEPHVYSWVHFHPVVTQVTYVLSGELTVRMKDAASPHAYDIRLESRQAVVSQAGTLFQLRNDSDAPADVLYIVSPSYVFEMSGGNVLYDDAVLVARTWEELAAANYDLRTIRITKSGALAMRAEALRRLEQKKGSSV